MGATYMGTTQPHGELGLRKFSRVPTIIPPNLSVLELCRHGLPHSDLPTEVRDYRKSNVMNFFRGLKKVAAAKLLKLPHFYGRLGLSIIRKDGEVIDLGIVSLRVVTTAGVNFIATRLFDANTSIGNFDFHGFGTGGTAEAIGDTALVTELTTQYVVDNTRPTGTPSNPSANVYQSVATLSPDSGGTIGVTEHGLFSASSGVTLLDRTLFSVVNIVASQDSLQATYQMTISAGG